MKLRHLKGHKRGGEVLPKYDWKLWSNLSIRFASSLTAWCLSDLNDDVMLAMKRCRTNGSRDMSDFDFQLHSGSDLRLGDIVFVFAFALFVFVFVVAALSFWPWIRSKIFVVKMSRYWAVCLINFWEWYSYCDGGGDFIDEIETTTSLLDCMSWRFPLIATKTTDDQMFFVGSFTLGLGIGLNVKDLREP